MVGECVRFLFTSCEGSLNERVSASEFIFSDPSQRVNNKNRTNEPNKHTSKLSKWNFLPFIALFSC